MLRILLRNIISNWSGYAVQAAVMFFLTPFVLHSLGGARYGIWSLVVSLTGYYGLLDLGFRSGMAQYMTRHLAKRDFKRLNRVASTGLVAFLAGGGLVVLASITIACIAPFVFNIPTNLVVETRWCILVTGISVGLQFPCYPFCAVFTATQRYDLTSAIGISTRLVTAAATFVALELGYGLVGLSVVNAVGVSAGYAVRWRLAYRVLPELVVLPALASIKGLAPIASFSAWSFIVRGGSQLKAYSSALIIGIFMPIEALAPYALAVAVVKYFENSSASIGHVFYPMATHLDTQGNLSRLRQLYLAGSKFLLLLAISGSTIGFVWSDDFYRLWVDEEYAHMGDFAPVAVLFCLLIVAAAFTAGQRVGYQVLLGTRRVRQLALLIGAEAILGLALSIWLVRSRGLVGVALGTLIPAVLFQGVIHPLCVCRLLGISAKAYFGHVWARPLLLCLALATLLPFIRQGMPPPDSWGGLSLAGLFAALGASVLIFLLGLCADERHRFVMQPIRRLLSFGLRRDIHGKGTAEDVNDQA